MNIKRLTIVLLIAIALLVMPCAYATSSFDDDIVKNAFDNAKKNNDKGNIFGNGGLVPMLFVDKNVENNILGLLNATNNTNDTSDFRESDSLEGFLKFFLGI
ncbi:MAG: hypothetical protein Q4P14_00860 [Methanobacteriaceae archaeon]|nr:hypothetical protein [Methanobacteriaceae archaeon]